ncbi:hypothetical protein ACWDZ8_43485 [Streptomyces sp. NPDC003233]
MSQPLLHTLDGRSVRHTDAHTRVPYVCDATSWSALQVKQRSERGQESSRTGNSNRSFWVTTVRARPGRDGLAADRHVLGGEADQDV